MRPTSLCLQPVSAKDVRVDCEKRTHACPTKAQCNQAWKGMGVVRLFVYLLIRYIFTVIHADSK